VPLTDPSTDGRTARAQRTRQAIVDALLGLIDDGDLAPTAPRIAGRAGVSLRSIYQHFEDLEALFGAASARQIQRVLDMATRIPPRGSVEKRVETFTVQRARILEAMTPVRRAALLQEPFSAQLRNTRRRMESLGRAEIGHVFACELDRLAPVERKEVHGGLEVASGWAAWDHMRATGLSTEEGRRVMRRTMLALLTNRGKP
jgi:TetR/AcrR family transcriptional regulator of autoinduction and epiphytic fitness